MKPTLQQIGDQARALLADTEPAGGAIFTNQVLQPHIASAIRELFRVLRGTEDPFVLTEAYWYLPANTSILDPATAGLTNLNIPEWVGWQLAGTTYPITGCVVTATGNPPYATITTGSPTTFSNGACCLTYGINGFDAFNNPNGLWTVNAPSPSSIQLNGCTATGTFTTSPNAQIMGITGQFADMAPMDQQRRISSVAGGNPVANYAWESGVFHFNPVSTPMVLRIIYRTSDLVSSSPTSVIPVDDSLDYIATRAAGLAAATRGATQRAEELKMEAMGPADDGGSGGLMRQLVQVMVRNMQRIPYRRREFRERRNRPDFLLY